MSQFRFFLFAIILATLSLMAHTSFADEERTASQNSDEIESQEDTYRLLNLFGEVFERVKQQYVDEVTDKQLIEAAINGMLTDLDPHSSFLNVDSYEDMKVQTRGSFGGLGIEVTMENGLVKVVSPIDDTPAFKAGIQAGDFIAELDGEPVMGLTLSEAVDKMRGKVGTKIVLGIIREGASDIEDITIVRDIIKIRSIRTRLEGDDIGYIRITTFNQQTEPNLLSGIVDIKKEAGDNLKGYVLDLRNNPGGLLTEAIAVADAFLEEGEIVSTRGRHSFNSQRDLARKGDKAEGMPIVVLINGGSASASEIVAGALQDHRRAVIMGTKSFGKGSVQTIISLPDDNAMKLTTARYYTPSGRSIQATGIEPDIIVEQAKVENIGEERRFRENDLRGALDRKAKTSSKNDDADDADSEDGEPVDYQLSRAVDLIRGLALYNQQNAVNPKDLVEIVDEQNDVSDNSETSKDN